MNVDGLLYEMPSAKEICKKRALDSAEAFDGPNKAIKLTNLAEYERPCMESHEANYSNSSVPLPENNGHHNHFVNETASVKTETSSDDQESSPLKPKALLELPVMPLIWAQSRQEVCESFDWFRSYQGGVYFTNNITRGYLLSGFPAKRDGFFCDGKLIVSHGGGKAESLQHSKGETKLKLADDQKAEDKSVRALLTNYNKQIPLVLIIDDRYALFPYDLGGKDITYAVLGVYIITHAWAEYETTKSGQKHVRFKFAFQWCEEQGQPWWHARKLDAASNAVSQTPVLSYPVVHTGCDETLENDNARTSETDYEDIDIPADTEEFTTVVHQLEAVPRTRRIPVKRSQFLLSERTPGRTDRTCSHCGMRSPLIFSVGWGCLTSTCPRFWTLPEMEFMSFPDELDFHENFLQMQTLSPLDEGFRNICPPPPVTSPSDKITTVQSFTRGMHCVKCGRLSCRSKWQHWECANCHNVLEVTGSIRAASELKNISTVISHYNILGKDTGIIREPPRFFGDNHTGGHVQTFVLPEGRGRIHHIQHNSMAPQEQVDVLFETYQKQASTGILPFRRWPLRSHKLRGSLLTNYFSQNCGEPYHYVGGSANTLSWEEAPSAVIDARNFILERTSQALQKELQFNEVLSAAYMEKQKMSFHTDDEKGLGEVVAGLSLGSPALMHFRRRYVKHGPERKTCLTVVLRHGDVLVMDGAGVQQFYEHMVEPQNFRIAATARWIDPNRK